MPQRTSQARWGGRQWQFRGFRLGWAGACLLIAALSAGLFWLVWIYGNGLRDARYLDGWILAAAMGLQIAFHVARKTNGLSPKISLRWRKLHIALGYLLIAAFVSHSDFSLPDTAFEWALWTGFVFVSGSGMFGTYLSWALRAKHAIDEHASPHRIETRRAALIRELHAIVVKADPDAAAIPLPSPGFDAWIMDLYATRLRPFVEARPGFVARLAGSRRALARVLEDVDGLATFVDPSRQQKLEAIKRLVVEKDRLDFERVYLGLTRGWLLVHVPATYGLIVLTVAHIVVVYAFSSGVW